MRKQFFRNNSKFLIFLLPLVCACQKQQTSTNTNLEQTKILDANNDGIINPYEALDVLFQLQKENKSNLTVKEFNKAIQEREKEQEEELTDLFEEFDTNNDQKIQFSEANEDMREFIIAMDTNKDEEVSIAEMKNFNFADAFLADEAQVTEMVNEIFNEHNSDTINLKDINKEVQQRLIEFDYNRDGLVTKAEAYNFMKANNTPVSFKVEGDTALMTGVITSETPATILQLFFEHPNVTTIEMITVPGSIDDVANLRASLYVNKFGVTTKLNANSSIASGGTDFFLAGKKRIVAPGARIGVHSWGGGNIPATELPKDDEAHKKYLDYYTKVGIPTDFYWYTLKAAPAGAMHTMTTDEIKKYKIQTTQN